MALEQKKHLGQNIRDMRVLKGLKQETLGRAMGMAQQNVSKMEKDELPTEAILERAAKALDTTVQAIKEFDKDAKYNFVFYKQYQHFHPIKEVIEYFKEELLKEFNEKQELRNEIESLKAELEALRGGSIGTDDKVKNIGRKAK